MTESDAMTAPEMQPQPINPPAAPPPAVPFAPPPPRQNPPPTPAQEAWLRARPDYVRISHLLLGKFTQRGTLRPCGTFIPEDRMALHDGNGDFSVGIPAAMPRKRGAPAGRGRG